MKNYIKNFEQVKNVGNVQEDDTQIGNITAAGQEEEEETDIHHHANVTIGDLIVVSSPHTTTPGMTTNSKKHGNNTSMAKMITNDNNSNDNNQNNDAGGLEKLLFGNLTDDQGVILKQLLLLREKEYQLQLQLIMKDKNHELILERKDHVHEMAMMLEQKNHELMVEQKNAEIAKQYYELELFKLRFLLENNASTTKDNHCDCTTTFTSKLEEIQERVEELITPTNMIKNRMVQIETKMDENNDTLNEKLVDCTTTLNTKIEKIQEQMEGITAPTKCLTDSLEAMKKTTDQNNNATNEKITDCTKMIEAIEAKFKKEINVLKQLLFPTLSFMNDNDSWKTFVASPWSAMIFGKHKWTIKLTTLNASGEFDCSVGLMTVSDHLQQNQNFKNSWVGRDVPGWGYSHGGTLYHDGICKEQRKGLPLYSLGDSLTFVLDLGINEQNKNTNSSGDCDDDNNGSLYMSVNDKEQHLLFSNLSTIAKSKGGFLPAISLNGNHQVCFNYDYEYLLGD